MSQKGISEFIQAIKNDVDLQEAIKKAGSDEKVISIAKERGFNIEDFDQDLLNTLTDSDLADAGGGKRTVIDGNTKSWIKLADGTCAD